MKYLLRVLLTLAISFNARAVCNIYDEATIVKKEIAGLLLEKISASGPTAPAIKSLIDENILSKLREYKEEYGAEPSADELQQLVLEAKDRLSKGVWASERKDARARTEEKSLRPFTEVFSKVPDVKLGTLISAHMNSDERVMSGNRPLTDGLEWTDDERYVHFRGDRGKSTIVDLKSMKEFNYHPKTGFFSSEGHLYVEFPKPQVMEIRDLDTGEVFKKLKGNVAWSLLTSKFVVARIKITPKKEEYWYVNYRTGKREQLREDVAVSHDWSKIVYSDGKQVQIFDTVNEQFLAPIKGVAEELSLRSGRSGFFTIKRAKEKFLVRLSDLKEFELPAGIKVKEFVAGGTKVVYEVSAANLIVVYDLISKKMHKFKGYSKVEVSPKDDMIYVTNYKGSGKLVDLNTMTITPVSVENLGEFSPNGRWLHGSVTNGQEGYEHRFYDILTGRSYSGITGYGLSFVGPSDRIIGDVYQQIDSPVSPIYMATPESFFMDKASFEIGESNSESSPSGKYIVTFRRKKLVILEVKP